MASIKEKDRQLEFPLEGGDQAPVAKPKEKTTAELLLEQEYDGIELSERTSALTPGGASELIDDLKTRVGIANRQVGAEYNDHEARLNQGMSGYADDENALLEYQETAGAWRAKLEEAMREMNQATQAAENELQNQPMYEDSFAQDGGTPGQRFEEQPRAQSQPETLSSSLDLAKSGGTYFEKQIQAEEDARLQEQQRTEEAARKEALKVDWEDEFRQHDKAEQSPLVGEQSQTKLSETYNAASSEITQAQGEQEMWQQRRDELRLQAAGLEGQGKRDSAEYAALQAQITEVNKRVAESQPQEAVLAAVETAPASMPAEKASIASSAETVASMASEVREVSHEIPHVQLEAALGATLEILKSIKQKVRHREARGTTVRWEHHVGMCESYLDDIKKGQTVNVEGVINAIKLAFGDPQLASLMPQVQLDGILKVISSAESSALNNRTPDAAPAASGIPAPEARPQAAPDAKLAAQPAEAKPETRNERTTVRMADWVDVNLIVENLVNSGAGADQITAAAIQEQINEQHNTALSRTESFVKTVKIKDIQDRVASRRAYATSGEVPPATASSNAEIESVSASVMPENPVAPETEAITTEYLIPGGGVTRYEIARALMDRGEEVNNQNLLAELKRRRLDNWISPPGAPTEMLTIQSLQEAIANLGDDKSEKQAQGTATNLEYDNSGVAQEGVAQPSNEAENEPGVHMTPEQARSCKWYSSNISTGEKRTPDGKLIYGLSLTTNPDYAQSYSRTKKINVFDLSAANLKPVSFTYGMTIDSLKRNEILGQGYDGILFQGMNGPEVALLTNVAKLQEEILPIPKGIQALVENRRSLPEKTVAEYNIQLPDGYILENGRYNYKGQH